MPTEKRDLVGVLVACFGRERDGPGLPGGFFSSTRETHLLPNLNWFFAGPGLNLNWSTASLRSRRSPPNRRRLRRPVRLRVSVAVSETKRDFPKRAPRLLQSVVFFFCEYWIFSELESFSPTAESFRVSAQIGSGVVRGGPEVRFFHEGSTRVPPGFHEDSTRFCEKEHCMLLGVSPELIFLLRAF